MVFSTNKLRYFAILGGFSLILSACAPHGPFNSRPKTNHFQGHYSNPVPPHLRKPRKSQGLLSSLRGKFGSRNRNRPQFQPRPQFQQWVEYEPEYRLYPGDQVDIVIASAPELSRTLTVGPDGRIVMPSLRPVMAAGRSFTQVQNELSSLYATQLRDPRVAITPRAYGPQQIFVGGQVGAQGTYTLPGPIGAVEAIFMAGGLQPTAKSSQIAVLRRAPNGGMMMRTINIGRGLKNIRQYNDVIQLRRGDIIFVPRNSLSEIGVWVQAVRNALPVDFNISYQIGNGGNGLSPVITTP